MGSTAARERYFAELCQSIYARHSSVLLMMARSAYELRGRMKVKDPPKKERVRGEVTPGGCAPLALRQLVLLV